MVSIDLGEALCKEWLELWYQPKIDLKTLSVCGAEALVRARHPEHGILSPAAFLPPAGDPQYEPLSSFVIRRAMTDWARFANAGMPLKLAVNIPVSVIHGPLFFFGFLRESLPRDERFPGLIIEVTEDEIIREPKWIREAAMRLKLYDVEISIDDFGSAYSSLSRLNDLPFVELKLDRCFVSNVSSDRLKRALCQTVVDLAHSFGALVCAEGVENPQDVRALIDMGCDTAQGFYFAKPMLPGPFVEKLLSRTIEQVNIPPKAPSDEAALPARRA
jgi:EAL domain-containing protein (putative c-di-GMP-specific phosphodiesterase class I)